MPNASGDPTSIDIINALTEDYWQDGYQNWRSSQNHSMLPDCPLGAELVQGGRRAYEGLLDILRGEGGDSLRFRNALFLLMYFDSLFVYRAIKDIYRTATDAQRVWLAEACRKILIRCFHYAGGRDAARFRDVSRNTHRGRLSTSPAVVSLASELSDARRDRAIVRDMAVADGITSLDIAVIAGEQDIPISIVATDRFLFLYFAELEGNKAAFAGDGTPIQYEIGGRTFSGKEGDATLDPTSAERITMLAPEVEAAAESGRCHMSFKEEDVLDPDPDIAEADIIRVANILVESTDSHRGYFTRDEIVSAIARLGIHARDSARLLLDNFREKVERRGQWRKDALAGKWIRLSTPAGLPDVLEGVGDIRIAQ